MQHMVRRIICLATVAGLGFGVSSAFALSVGENVIVNGGFESATMQNASRNPDWWNINTGDDSTKAIVPGWGEGCRLIAGKNGYVIKSTTFKQGKYCVVIQMSGTLGQTFTTDAKGLFTLSYRYMHRDDYNANLPMYYTVTIDGETVVPEETLAGNDVTIKNKSVPEILLAAGEHTIVFQGRTDDKQDSSMYIDDISLVASPTFVVEPIPDQSFSGAAIMPDVQVSFIGTDPATP